MKKALSVFLTAVLVLSVMLSIAVPSFAASQPTLLVSKQTSGDTMTVKVDLSGNSNLSGLRVVLRYSTEELEYVKGSFTKYGLIGYEVLNDEKPGRLVYASAMTGSTNAGGTLVSAKFKTLKADAKVSVEVIEAIDPANAAVPVTVINPFDGEIVMYRLYNSNSGEHFYTADLSEKNNLVSVGWKYEGIGWVAPGSSDKPVYRLYNQNGGEHHYTLSAEEIDILVSAGWKLEGIGWYSADTTGVPLYRQYNPNAFANNHNYTTDKSENDWLVTMGWRAEGIGWYGIVA